MVSTTYECKLCQSYEQAMLDDAGCIAQGLREGCRVGDLSKAAVENLIAVVGQEGASVRLGA